MKEGAWEKERGIYRGEKKWRGEVTVSSGASEIN